MDDIIKSNIKYDLIVIDPPWNIKKITHRSRMNQNKMDYQLMSLDDIKNLPIDKISNENSWCFLWTIQKYLFDAKEILKIWGFHYLCMGVWKKTYGISSGMPLYGFRYNAEFIAIGYKGKKPILWPKRKLIDLVFDAENLNHSKKPNIFYERIKVLGEKRIDIFAREEKKDWDCWGNEVNI